MSDIRLMVFQRDAFQNVSHVFTSVGSGFEALVNFFPFDYRHRIGLFVEELGNGITGNPVGLVFETVDLYAALFDVGMREAQSVYGSSNGDRRLVQQVGPRDGYVRLLVS